MYSHEIRVEMVKQRVRELQRQRKCIHLAVNAILAVLLCIVAAAVLGRKKIYPADGERKV